MIYMYSGPDAVLTNAINLHSRVEHPKTQVCCVLIDPILKNQKYTCIKNVIKSILVCRNLQDDMCFNVILIQFFIWLKEYFQIFVVNSYCHHPLRDSAVGTTFPLGLADTGIAFLPHGNKQEINFAFHKLFPQQGDRILID